MTDVTINELDTEDIINDLGAGIALLSALATSDLLKHNNLDSALMIVRDKFAECLIQVENLTNNTNKGLKNENSK